MHLQNFIDFAVEIWAHLLSDLLLLLGLAIVHREHWSWLRNYFQCRLSDRFYCIVCQRVLRESRARYIENLFVLLHLFIKFIPIDLLQLWCSSLKQLLWLARRPHHLRFIIFIFLRVLLKVIRVIILWVFFILLILTLRVKRLIIPQ